MIGTVPAIEMNYAPIEEKMGQNVRDNIFSLSDEIKNSRAIIGPSRKFNEANIGFLIGDLESQLKTLCRGKQKNS